MSEIEENEEIAAAETEGSPAGEPEKSEQEAAGEERRRTYRLNKVLGATLTSEEGESKNTRLFVIDISESGFRATDHQPPSEEEYVISIALAKGEEPFVSRMRVVWVKELTVSGMFQMGCEFQGTLPEQAEKLRDFIEAERNKLAAPKSGGVSIKNPWTMIN